MMKNRVKFCTVFFLIGVFIMTMSSYATGFNAKDNGKSGEFQLVEYILQQSDKDAEVGTQIKLLFNKNVVNFKVKENNSKCFKLLYENKEIIPMDIIFADDQIEPDKKREIILEPKEALKENITYTVEISSELQAKNGSNLGEKVSFDVTTMTPPVEENKEEVNKQVPEESKETNLGEEEATADEVSDDTDKKGSATLIIAAFVAIIGSIIIISKRNKKRNL